VSADGVEVAEPAKEPVAPEQSAAELEKQLYKQRRIQIAQSEAKKREAFEAERAQFNKEREELAAYKREVEALKRAKAGDMKAISEIGLTPEFFKASLEGVEETQEMRAIREMREEVAALKAAREEEAKQRQTAAQERAEMAERRSVLGYAAKNVEKFALLTARYDNDALSLLETVRKVAQNHTATTGMPVDLSNTEHVDEILDFLEQQENMHYTSYVARKSVAGLNRKSVAGSDTEATASFAETGAQGLPPSVAASRESAYSDPSSLDARAKKDAAALAYEKALRGG
jgi:hypothetical protein